MCGLDETKESKEVVDFLKNPKIHYERKIPKIIISEPSRAIKYTMQKHGWQTQSSFFSHIWLEFRRNVCGRRRIACAIYLNKHEKKHLYGW